MRIDDTAVYLGNRITNDFALHDGHLDCDKAPGATLTAIPAVLAARVFVEDPSTPSGIAVLSWVATLATSAVPTAVAAELIFLVATRFGLSSSEWD